MSIRSAQIHRVRLSLFKAGEKGLRETQIIYLEQRHHELGEEFTRETLLALVMTGTIERLTEGPKRFKTISDKEKKQVVRYRYVGKA